MAEVEGKIKAIRGLVAEVEFSGEARPALRELLSGSKGSEALLEVQSFIASDRAICINLTSSYALKRGAKVKSLGGTVGVPIGDETLGRLFNALGQPIDGGKELTGKRRSIYATTRGINLVQPTEAKPEILETGIKVIDFFTPFVKGRKIGIIGGAGVGKTVVIMALMRNIAMRAARLSFFVGIGERIREGYELYQELKDTNILPNTVLFFGQMNEGPAMRSLVGLSAATLAEYFRDEQQRDVLFFADNMYRHIQAGNELSTTIGQTPSEGGYQPTMSTDLKRLQDRLYSNEHGSITSVQTIYMPADDLGDPAVQEIYEQLDSVIVLSRAVAESGRRPAVDLSKTTSSLLMPEMVGDRHYVLATQVQEIMQKYDSLKNIIAIVGESELSATDKADYHKAQKIMEFFQQDLFPPPGEKVAYFSLEQTLRGIEEIII